MDFNKAIRILGLTSNFTEEELRKAYRMQITNYHPDKYVSKSEEEIKEAEEKAKEINTAKEYLEMNKQRNKNIYKNTETEQVILRKEQFKITLNYMKEELASIIAFDVHGSNDCKIIQEAINDISFLIKTIERQMNLIFTLEAVRIQERTYYNRLNYLLEEFEKKYCKKYNITIGNKKLDRYSLKKYYEELKKIRKKHNLFYIKLEEEYEKYMSYAGFNRVSPQIYIIKKEIVEHFKLEFGTNNDDDITINQIIEKFNKNVLELFSLYYKNIKILNELKEKYKETKDLEIRKLLMWAEEYAYDKDSFSYYMRELEKHIKYEERKASETKIKTGIRIKEKKYNTEKYEPIVKEYLIKDKKKIEHPNYKIKKRIKNTK